MPKMTKSPISHLWVVLGIVSLAMAALSVSASEKAMLQGAWVREAAPNMMMHAAYLTVMNPGTKEIHLVGVESSQYVKAELHLSKVANGVATMVRQNQLTIPAGGTLVLKPGSFHIMLVKPIEPVKAGDEIDLSLRFADGAAMSVKALVRKGDPTAINMHKHLKMN